MNDRFRITMLGGPNLGQLGKREPALYGSVTWPELENLCREWSADLGCGLVFEQADGEGELVGLIHQAGRDSDGLILNAAAYTHTSVAVRDAVLTLEIPVLELHLTNPASREPFRQQNLLQDVVTCGIFGLGTEGYRLALHGMAALLKMN